MKMTTATVPIRPPVLLSVALMPETVALADADETEPPVM